MSYTCPSTALTPTACGDACDTQALCDMLCMCDPGCNAGSKVCTCDACSVVPAEQDPSWLAMLAQAGNGTAMALNADNGQGQEVGRRLAQTSSTGDGLGQVLSAVSTLQTSQTALAADVQALATQVQAASAASQGSSVASLISSGQQAIASRQADIQATLQTILGKQTAAAAAQAATVQALSSLQAQQLAAQQAAASAAANQLSSIELALQQGIVTTSQALELFRRTRRAQLAASKEAMLSNAPCTTSSAVQASPLLLALCQLHPANPVSAPQPHSYPSPCCSTPSPLTTTLTARWTPRVSAWSASPTASWRGCCSTQRAAPTAPVSRRASAASTTIAAAVRLGKTHKRGVMHSKVTCGSQGRRKPLIAAQSHLPGLSIEPYGVDPTFKAGTASYDPTAANSVTSLYNCSALPAATYNLTSPPAILGSAAALSNPPPYCAELFNPRTLPWGFTPHPLAGYSSPGFPAFFDINLSAEDAAGWVQYLSDGLFLDARTRTLAARLVTYNARLRAFGSSLVQLEFATGGAVEVSSRVQVVRLELYATALDRARLGLELVLAVCVAGIALSEARALAAAARLYHNPIAYFRSGWRLLDFCSAALLAGTTLMWWVGRAAQRRGCAVLAGRPPTTCATCCAPYELMLTGGAWSGPTACASRCSCATPSTPT